MFRSGVRLWTTLGVLSLVLLALDTLTGPYILFPVTFVLPVGLAAWHAGRTPALLVAVVLSGARYLNVALRHPAGFTPDVNMLNALIRMSVFVGEAYLVARVAADHRSLAASAADAERRLGAIMNSVADAVIGTDAAGRITAWNATAERMFGRPRAEVEGEAVLDVVRPAPNGPRLALPPFSSIDTGGNETYGTVLGASGHILNVGLSAAPVTGVEGAASGYAIVIRDLTDRQRLDATYRAVLDSAVQGIILLDRDGWVLDANRTVLDLYGVAIDEVRGQHFTETPWRLHADAEARTRFDRAIDAVRGGTRVHAEVVQHRTGGDATLNVFLTPVQNAAGQVVSILVESHDVTALRDNARQLEAANAQLAEVDRELRWINGRLELVNQGSAAGIWDWNVLTNEDYFSPQWCRMLGYDEGEFAPHFETWRRLLHPEEEAQVLTAVSRHLDRHEPYDLEYRMRMKCGDYRWFRATGQAEWDAEGRPTRMAGSIIDVHDRRQAESDLRQSLQVKDTLLREVHHRVKNNLAAINSMLYLQAGADDGRPVREVLDDCRARIHAIAMVHERLYGTSELSRVDLTAYVQDLVRHTGRALGVPHESVTMTLDSEPVTLSLQHAVPCGLILNELVTNALKHQPPSARPVEVRLRRGHGTQVELAVTNDASSSLAPSGDRPPPLGLRLVSALARQLGGDFTLATVGDRVESRLSFGADHGHVQ